MAPTKYQCLFLSVRQSPGYHPLHKSPEKATQTLIPYLTASLNRDLTQYEQDLLTYPRLCNVCLDGNQGKKCFSLVVLFWDSLKVRSFESRKDYFELYA